MYVFEYIGVKMKNSEWELSYDKMKFAFLSSNFKFQYLSNLSSVKVNPSILDGSYAKKSEKIMIWSPRLLNYIT